MLPTNTDYVKALLTLDNCIPKDDNSQGVVSEGIVLLFDQSPENAKIADAWFKENNLDVLQTNATFYSDWSQVMESDEVNRWHDQAMYYILHSIAPEFITSRIVRPQDLDLPPDTPTIFSPRTVTDKDVVILVEKFLSDGAGLSESLLQAIFTIYKYLDTKGITISSKSIKVNKELTTLVIDFKLRSGHGSDLNRYIDNPDDALRLLVQQATGLTQPISNRKTIQMIKSSDVDVEFLFNAFPLAFLAQNFRRKKNLYLAFKERYPTIINRIGRLSKKNHKVITQDVLQRVRTERLDTTEHRDRLSRASAAQLLRAINALGTYQHLGNLHRRYAIRNGKVWVSTPPKVINTETLKPIINHNYQVITHELRVRLGDSSGVKVYVPQGVNYGLPATKKSMVGNLPVDTTITLSGSAAVGVWWNSSDDLDLSSVSLSGIVSDWRSQYLGPDPCKPVYTGDVRTGNGPYGGAEYYLFTSDLKEPQLLSIKNFSSGQRPYHPYLVITAVDLVKGKPAGQICRPENRIITVPLGEFTGKHSLARIYPSGEGALTIHLISGNIKGGNDSRVNSGVTSQLDAAVAGITPPVIDFRSFLQDIGYSIVEDPAEADIDLSLNSVTATTLPSLFLT